jgi:hypothetical protein
VKLEGTASNRSAIGARVTVHYGGKRQSQEVLSQASFYSTNDPRLHFGLGGEAMARVEIGWPSGKTQRLEDVTVNQILRVTEPAP